MIAEKAVVFTHLPVQMPRENPVYDATAAERLIARVKPYFTRYLQCRNIGLVYVYVDTGLRLTLKHLSQSKTKPLEFTIDELDFEQSTRNCLKLALDEACNELRRNLEAGFNRALAPSFQIVGLPHLLSLIHALYKVDRKLLNLLAGPGSQFSYDSPKFIEAVIRVVRGENAANSHYPIFRIDEDVQVNETAIKELLSAAGRTLQDNLHQYVFFSGGYGGYGRPTDLVNDYAVRLHWLVDRSGNISAHHAESFLRDLGEIGATQVDSAKSTSAAVASFVKQNRNGRSANRATQQVISGAGLYMSCPAIRTLPPFMNFSTLTTWVDDHLKRMLHETLGHMTPAQHEHLPSVLFSQKRHPSGIRSSDIEWAVREYFPRLLSGCIMHSLIKTPEGRKGVLSDAIDSVLRTMSFHVSETILKESIRSTASSVAQEILSIWAAADYGTPVLADWAKGYDATKLVEALTRDAYSYIFLVSVWHKYVEAMRRLSAVDAYWLFRSVDAMA